MAILVDAKTTTSVTATAALMGAGSAALRHTSRPLSRSKGARHTQRHTREGGSHINTETRDHSYALLRRRSAIAGGGHRGRHGEHLVNSSSYPSQSSHDSFPSGAAHGVPLLALSTGGKRAGLQEECGPPRKDAIGEVSGVAPLMPPADVHVRTEVLWRNGGSPQVDPRRGSGGGDLAWAAWDRHV